ncbi:trypsin-like peptidase domain-containing protein [Lentzea sp. JNUCC 0626]|uniref:trypsin-like peptidase domain-containing protein n=1 Tax=Lentzea sp. JNUCC 0626 TaxID=3367513 RepID=UPI00374955D7
MSGAPLDRSRVAELIVTRAGERHRGSGYRVRTDAVLTAAHVVDGAESVRLRFEPDLPGERIVAAVSWWADPVSDIAVVMFEPADALVLAPVSFGRIEDRAAVLSVAAVGFPRWKMRTDDAGLKYRDSCHVTGTVAVLSNWREGTLEVVVEPAGPAEGEASPWQGMSGAALWAGGQVVGVLAKHHPGDGRGRLAAARIDLALDRVDPAHGTTLRDALSAPAALRAVLPPHRPALTTSTYQALVAEAAPERLHDRNWELGELVKFCAGDEPYLWWQAGPWAGKSALLAWFAQHPPDGVDVVSYFITGRWAGQSDSDAFTEALIEQLAALVGEAPEPALEAKARRGHTLRLLNAAAAACEESGRTLLLVVDGLDEDTSRDDGLGRPSIASLLPRRLPPSTRVVVASRPHPDLPDDVAGDHPLRTVRPSLLSVSPYAKNLETEAKRELTTLLAKPGPQRDVLGLITASGGGLTQSDLEELTDQPRYELDALFGGILGRSVGARAARDQGDQVYLFTHDTLREQAERAYGKGLAAYLERVHAWADDHQARGWTGEAPEYLLRGYPRLLAARGEVDRLVTLALDRSRHDRMLDRTGADGLALAEIVAAAGLVAQASVPDLGVLLRLGAVRSDLGQRNADIPAKLPGVWAALGEDDRALALVNSIVDDEDRVRALTGVVAALAKRGEHARVARMANDVERAAAQLPNLQDRLEVLCALVEALVIDGEQERVERVVREVERSLDQLGGSYTRDEIAGKLVMSAVKRGDHERAFGCLELFADDFRQSILLEGLPLTVQRTDGDELALRYAMAIRNDYLRDQELGVLAQEVQADPGRALLFLERVHDWDGEEAGPVQEPGHRELAVAALNEGDDELAVRCARAAEEPDDVLAELIDLLGAGGDLGRATWFADRLVQPDTMARAWSTLALARADAADHAEASRLVELAEGTLLVIDDLGERACVLERLALTAGVLGEHDRKTALRRAADEEVGRIGDLAACGHVLGAMSGVAALGDAERYVDLADRAAAIADRTSGDERLALLSDLASSAVDAEDGARVRRFVVSAASEMAESESEYDYWPQRRELARLALVVGALDLALLVFEPVSAVADLCSLLRLALESGDDDRARRIVELVLEAVPQYDTFTDQIESLTRLGAEELVFAVVNRTGTWMEVNRHLGEAVKVAAETGDDDLALRLAAAFSTSFHRGDSCGDVAVELASTGEHDRADRYLNVIEPGYRRDQILVEIARAAWERGDHTRARAVLDGVSSRTERAAGVAELSAVTAATGDADFARRLCLEVENIARAGEGAEVIRERDELAIALAVAGDLDRADRLASTTDDLDMRIQVCTSLVNCALDSGDASRARALAGGVAEIEGEPVVWRFDVVVEMLLRAGAAGAADRVATALESIATRCTDHFERPRWYSVLAGALAVAGRHEEAVGCLFEIETAAQEAEAYCALARTLPAGPLRNDVQALITEAADALNDADRSIYWLGDITEALVLIGDLDRAWGLVHAGFGTSEQTAALLALLKALPDEPAERREFSARLESAATDITDLFYRDWVLRDLARKLDEKGDHDEALRIAGLIPEGSTREESLRDIRLRAIATGRETAGARKYVAEVLATKDWSAALPALAKVDLPMLQAFADEVLG